MHISTSALKQARLSFKALAMERPREPRVLDRLQAMLLIFFACMFQAALAKTVYVSLGGNAVSPYGNWTDAATNIYPEAYSVAVDGDEILVSNGTYTVFPSGRGMTLNRNITVTSLYGAASTILDGGEVTNTGIYATGGVTSMVYGFTITNWNGRGVHISDHLGVGLILDSCVIAGNESVYTGGGINHQHGYLWVTNCIIRGNIARRGSSYSGGGVYFAGTRLQMDNCVVSDNQTTGTGYGGGIFVLSPDWTIRNTTISGNMCGSYGGGICASWSGGGLMANCILRDNGSGGRGGGADLGSGSVIEDCLIVSNTNGNRGAGAYLLGSTMRNCTVVSNSTSYQAGGVTGTAGSKVINSIVYFNTGANSGGVYSNYLNGAEAAAWTNCCTGADPADYSKGVGCIADTPGFTDRDAGDFRLAPNSPCINTALPESWMDTAKDIDGRRRIDMISGKPDMGAYEYVCPITMFIFR